jgi:hypothetical protein
MRRTTRGVGIIPAERLQRCGKDKSLGEQPTSYTTPEFLQQIAFPQRASIARFTDPEKVLALR